MRDRLETAREGIQYWEANGVKFSITGEEITITSANQKVAAFLTTFFQGNRPMRDAYYNVLLERERANLYVFLHSEPVDFTNYHNIK